MKRMLENLIKTAVSDEFSQELAERIAFVVSVPPKPDMGDYATNVAMVLAKDLKKSPKEVAEQLVDSGQWTVDSIQKVEVLGGFINFHLKPEPWFREVIAEIENRKLEYGTSKSEHPEKIMVEYLSPNTNKPLHLGHLRNGVTGRAVINLLSAIGHSVLKAEIINDRGVHICKAMLAYKYWGAGKTPESLGQKSDHFVGSYYVKFAQEAVHKPELENEAQEMLQKWEAGDAETVALWKQIRQWVTVGWKPTEDTLGFAFDKVYFESDVYKLGRDIIEDGLARDVFRKNEKGNVIFDLNPTEFGTNEDGSSRVITVLRADGTSLYYTQDIGLQTSRVAEFHLDRIIHVVGSEQNFYFKSLFAIFKALGYAWADKLYHLSYAMVYLPDGKMKSREGTVVDTDDLIAQMMKMAKGEIESRIKNQESRIDDNNVLDAGSKTGMTQVGIDERAGQVALAAIKFHFLKQKTTSDIHFNPKESLSFEGFTGPYCQYTYARAKSILRQVDSGQWTVDSGQIDYSGLGNEDERKLLQLLESYPEVVTTAAQSYDPSHLTTFIFQTAQTFNQFYSSSPVMKAEEAVKVARLNLVSATAQVLKNGLSILGIEAPEQM